MLERFGPLAIAAGIMVVGLAALTTTSSTHTRSARLVKARTSRPCRLSASAQPAKQRRSYRRSRPANISLNDRTLRLAPRRFPLYAIPEDEVSTLSKPSSTPSKTDMDIAWNIHAMTKSPSFRDGDLFASTPSVAVS